MAGCMFDGNKTLNNSVKMSIAYIAVMIEQYIIIVTMHELWICMQPQNSNIIGM